MISTSHLPPSNLTICAPACIKRVAFFRAISALPYEAKGRSATKKDLELARATQAV